MAIEKSGRGVELAADDPHYNLISILYHALKGADLYDEYIADAEAANDNELRDFFSEVQREESLRAQKARELLKVRLERQGWSIGSGQSDVEKAAE